jgi:hypothetical protein
MNDTLVKVNLIKRTKNGMDTRNQIKYTENARAVYARPIPLSRSEYFNAGIIGITPQLVLEISAFDYKGETLLQYPAGENGRKYRIYRVYEKNVNQTELYCEYAAGANGG